MKLTLFTGQLHVLLASGIPLVSALHVLATDDIIEDVVTHLTEGNRLSSSLARHPEVFDKIYVRMVHMGEQSGRLAEVIGGLARTLQRRDESRQRVTRALIYPAALLAFSLVVTGFLFCYMLPRFLETFQGMGLQLPWMTRALMFVFGRPWLTVGAVVLGVGLLSRLDWRRLPLLRRLVLSRALAQMCADMAMMMQAGLPFAQVLGLLATGVPSLDSSLRGARRRLEAGDTLVACFEGFPSLFVSTVGAAEPSGKLDQFLLRLADLLTMQADMETDQVLTLVEPLILGLLGVVVGVVVLAVFLPVYSLATFMP